MLGKKDDIGLDKDVDKGLKWLKKAAENDYVKANRHLAIIYKSGEHGINKDITLFEHYLVRAAELGDSEMQVYLGLIYAQGEELPEDREKAKFWLEEGIKSGHQDAEKFLLFFKLHDIQIEHEVKDPSNPSEDEWKKTRKLFESAAHSSDVNHISFLAKMYRHGLGGEQDKSKALQLYTKAYEIEPKSTAVQLGRMHELGEGGLKKDIKKAEMFYRQANDLGAYNASFYLGFLLERQLIDIEADTTHQEKARSLYEASSEAGFEVAQCYVKLLKSNQHSQSSTPEQRYKVCEKQFFEKNKQPPL